MLSAPERVRDSHPARALASLQDAPHNSFDSGGLRCASTTGYCLAAFQAAVLLINRTHAVYPSTIAALLLSSDLWQRHNFKRRINYRSHLDVEGAQIVVTKYSDVNGIAGTPGCDQRFERFLVNVRAIQRHDLVFGIQSLLVCRSARAHVFH